MRLRVRVALLVGLFLLGVVLFIPTGLTSLSLSAIALVGLLILGIREVM